MIPFTVHDWLRMNGHDKGMNYTQRVQCPDLEGRRGRCDSFKLLMHYLDFRIIETRAWYGSKGTIPTVGISSFDFPRGLQNVILDPTIAVSLSIVRVFGAWRALCSIAFGRVRCGEAFLRHNFLSHPA